MRRVSVDATTISIDRRESAIPATGVVKAQQSLFKSNDPPDPDVFSSAAATANLIQKQEEITSGNKSTKKQVLEQNSVSYSIVASIHGQLRYGQLR